MFIIIRVFYTFIVWALEKILGGCRASNNFINFFPLKIYPLAKTLTELKNVTELITHFRLSWADISLFHHFFFIVSLQMMMILSSNNRFKLKRKINNYNGLKHNYKQKYCEKKGKNIWIPRQKYINLFINRWIIKQMWNASIQTLFPRISRLNLLQIFSNQV